MLVIDAHRCDVFARKWNLPVPAYLDNAATVDDHSLENSSILELHGNNLRTETSLFRAFQVFCTPTGNGYQPFHLDSSSRNQKYQGERNTTIWLGNCLPRRGPSKSESILYASPTPDLAHDSPNSDLHRALTESLKDPYLPLPSKR